MGKKDPRVDAYIAEAKPFARPVLKRLRKLMHQGCPDLEETIKWGMPHFDHRGRIMAGMAAFKEHCAFGFWRASSIVAAKSGKLTEAMGQFGRITSLADLPSDAKILKLVQAAAKLNEATVTVKRPKAPPKAALPVPADLAKALAKNKQAKAAFAALSPSQRRDYIEWLIEAKREETRANRLATALGWIAEGKSRNWKYQKA